MSNNYDANTIKTLEYFDHIRQYPGMYIGSKDINGLYHCIKEILSNSIDEFLNGAGDTIHLILQSDNGIFISDNGRGIPHGKHPSGCSLLQACFGIANTGGKFDNATGTTGYNTSGGEHGTGGKAVNALSTKMIVTSARDGIKEIVEFLKGRFVSYKTENSTEQGTTVLFYPDKDIFEDIEIKSSYVKNMIQEFSFLCTDLTFIFEDEKENTKEIFCSKNGLLDYINFLNKNKTFLCPPIHFTEKEGKFEVEVALAYTTSYTSIVKLYTNNIPQEKGTHLTGFKTAFTSLFNNFAREKKWLKEKDENLTGADLEEGQILIINFRMIDPVFKGQNKEELSSSEGRTYVQKLSTIALKDYFYNNEKDVKGIADKAINARRAREAAKKAREAARGQVKKKEKAVKFDTKLADCFSKDRLNCEVYIVDGDSAAANLKTARDNEFQAVMPVRGKILNTQKATLDKIQKNAEIMNMIDAFGLRIDTKSMKVTYDRDDIRYGKIIIMSDADVDGAHIKNLFYTFIWNFCPELIRDGYIYAGVPPLYKITTSKGYKYLKNDEELFIYQQDNKGKKYTVTRMKGLGEMGVEETEETLTDPDNRILKQITINDFDEADNLFDDLMGTRVVPRKEFIKEHSKEATYAF